jgi:hypothetical protein
MGHKPVTSIGKLGTTTHHDAQDIRTLHTRINWDGEPSGYAENPENLIFLSK